MITAVSGPARQLPWTVGLFSRAGALPLPLAVLGEVRTQKALQILSLQVNTQVFWQGYPPPQPLPGLLSPLEATTAAFQASPIS